jgi:hypothetical protein
MEQNLRIAGRRKYTTQLLQVMFQLDVVVYFSVIDNRATIPGHRLVSRYGKIDNGKTPMAKSDPFVRRNPDTCSIWPAMRHAITHPLQDVFVDRFLSIVIKYSYYSTH